MHFSSVDFPEPLWPRMPTVWPCSISALTFCSAWKSTCPPRPRRTSRSLNELIGSVAIRNDFETLSIEIGVHRRSERLGQVDVGLVEDPQREVADRGSRRPP